MKKIDLHGIKHEFVSRRLDTFFWEMMQKNVSEIEVITGISNRMKEIVKETCIDYNFNCIEHPTNYGCLIVKIN
jgi:DNA-nicking Smr family endonuclease